MAILWQADDGPFIVLFGSSHLKKKCCKVEPPLAKLPGSAHAVGSKEPSQ